MAPIPPYEYPAPSPIVDRKPAQAQPYQRPPEPEPKPFIEYIRPARPIVPEKPVERVQPDATVQPDNAPVVPATVVMSHPETVSLPPQEEVQRYKKPVVEEPKSLTPAPAEDLTPVKAKPLTKQPERINEKLTNQPQSVNSSETRPLNFSGPKLPKKLQFKGHPGRQRTNEQVVELLTFAQNRGAFPNGISSQMQRYYRREYPEYFRKGRKKGSGGKVPVTRSAPIDIQARRSGTGN